LEIIGEMFGNSATKVVLSSKIDYFSDKNASEIIDGEFHVIGKVIRVLDSNSAPINLLRKTGIGSLNADLFWDQFSKAFEEVEKAGINIPKLTREIRGPALQVIPIAIYI
jgi:hypothetical protein